MNQMDRFIYSMKELWRTASKYKRAFLFLLAYTFIFSLSFLLVYSAFIFSGKSFIWTTDGRSQFYPALAYIGRYLRQLCISILHGEWNIPLFDLNIGLGEDIISSLNFYGLGDPLHLIAVFVPTRYIEYLYDFLFVFRLYLSGLSFIALCHYYKKRISFSFVGAIIYIYSGYAIIYAVCQSNFVNPMIQFPILIIGMDRIMQNRKPYIFIFAIFYSTLCGYYFLYIMTLLLGIYFIVRFFDYHSSKCIKAFANMAGRIIVNYLLGIGMASVLLIPNIIGYFSSCRAGQINDRNYLSYGWSYYREHILRAIAPPGSWNALSMSAIVIFAIALLFYKTKNKYRSLKIYIVTAAFIYALPLGGYIMNGFGYPAQRWTFGFALLLAYLVVELLPELIHLSNAKRLLCGRLLVIYSICVFVGSKNRNVYYVVGAAMLAITFSVLVMIGKESIKSKHREYIRTLICLLLVIGNVSVIGNYRYASDQMNYANNFKEHGVETERLENLLIREVENLLSKNEGRVDSSSFSLNEGLVWHIPSLNSYWSFLNNNTSEFWRTTENIGQKHALHVLGGIDQRTRMGTLLSGKYYIEKSNRTQYVPYGYEFFNETEKGNLIYKNKYALPWGYTYEHYTRLDPMLNGLKFEEVSLQSIFLEKDIEGIHSESPECDKLEIPFEIKKEEKLKWSNGVISVSKENATLTLTFQLPPNEESYLYLQGLDLTDSGQSRTDITVKCSNISKQISAISPTYSWYFGRNNYLINLGYSGEPRTSCTITFPKKGTFKLESIKIYALPFDNYPAQIEALREEPLENIEFSTNRITGTVDLSKNKILCMSIPYSKGWSAKVDGKPVEILRGNIMFMAIPLEAGYHEIEFTYFTPGLKLGIVCSLTSGIIVAAMLIRDRRRRKAEGVNKQND